MKMDSMSQGYNQSVSEYIHELQETFNMVGALTPELKIIKLWYSLRPNIQRTMWKDGLHPDTSTWDEIVAKAEVIEIASKVVDPRDRRSSHTPRQNSRANTSNHGNNDRNRPSHQDLASRTVTFTPSVRNNGNDRNNFHNRNNGGHQHSDRPYPARGRVSNNNRRILQDRTRNNNGQQRAIKAPEMSEKEMAELRAAGKCFNCKETGHMSRNCPQKNSMKGSTSRPPGVPNYSIQMDLIEDHDDHDEVLESMPIGMIILSSSVDNSDYPSDWRKHYPHWRNSRVTARRRIGDSLVLMSEYLLTIEQPYPGDNLFYVDEVNCRPEGRFLVTKSTDLWSESYYIVDNYTRFEVYVPTRLLWNTKFNLAHWYAKRRARFLGLKDTLKLSYLSSMGDALCEVTNHLLRQGINGYFPNADPTTDLDDRFFVFFKDFGSSTIIIIDEDLNLRIEVDRKSVV